jgi:outer membrane receptor for ferrienterochelin and colicin
MLKTASFVKQSLTLIPIVLSASVNAANTASTNAELETMVVTATPGRTQAVKDVQASIEVITQQRLNTLSLRTLPQVLQYAVGSGFVKDTGTTSTINLRGSSNNQTLILVDGLRRTGKYGTSDLTGISIENIQQIEIIRGPMSALYGADSIGGVINIITKTPADTFGATGSFTFGQAEHGQRDTFITRAGVSTGEFFGLKNRFSAEVFNKNALQIDRTVPTTTLKDIQRYYINYAGTYDLTPKRTLKWTGEIMNQDDTGVAVNGSKGTEVEERMQFNGFYDDVYDWGSVKLQGGYGQSIAHVGRDANNPNVLEKTNYKLGQIEGFLNYYALDNLSLTFGAGGRFQEMDLSTFDRTKFPGAQKRNVFHVLSQMDWDIINDVKLIAGVRYDNFSDFGDTINPRASLSWSPSDFNFRFGYGQAFKAPEFVNMYPVFTRNSLRGGLTSTSIINGNPNLVPETAESMEVAGKYNFDYGMVSGSFEAIGHLSNYKNLIQYVTLSTIRRGRTVITSGENQNVGQAKIQGIETVLNLGVKDYYNLISSYELLDAYDTQNHVRLLDRSRHAFRFQNIFHVHPQVDVSLNGRFYAGYVGQNALRVPETAYHQEFDAKVDYSPTKWFTAFAGVDNVFNRLTPFVMGSQGTPNDPGLRYYYTGFNVSY